MLFRWVLLVIFSLEARELNGNDSNFGEKLETPEFMLNFYKKYSRSEYGEEKNGDIVKSFLPKLGYLFDEKVLLFNLSSLAEQEEDISSARLYFYKNSEVNTNITILVQEFANIPLDLESFEVLENEHGWISKDLTYPDKPFLVVFATDQKKSRKRTGRSIHDNEIDDSIINAPALETNGHDSNGGKFFGASKGFQVAQWDKNGKKSENMFYPPTVSTNRDTETNNVIEHVSQGLTDSRSNRKGKKKSKKKHTKYIPYPKGYKKVGSKKQKKNGRKIPVSWLQVPDQISNEIFSHPDTEKQPYGDDGTPCKLRTFSVDIDEIGWSDWMISPKTIDINICAGSCSLSDSLGASSTNYASLSRYLQALGKFPGLRPPCCVPDELTSVTLLYFDEDRNVVLKNYPEMSAVSCRCR